MKTKSTVFNIFLIIGLLISFEVFSSLFGLVLGLPFLNFNFAIFFSLFIILSYDLKKAPYLLLVIQLIHALFSFDHWGIETLTAIFILVLVKVVENFLRLESYFNLFIFSTISSFVWLVFSSFLLSIKAQNISILNISIGNAIIETLILSVLFPFFYDFLKSFEPEHENSELN